MKPEKQTLHYSGRVVSLTTDEVVLPNGHRALLEVVHHPGGAAVAAIDAEERVCLLRQYRYVADGWIWELPAGKLEPQEPPLATAQRELIEEAGISAQAWRDAGRVPAVPGSLQRAHIPLYGHRARPRGQGARARRGHPGALGAAAAGLPVGARWHHQRHEDRRGAAARAEYVRQHEVTDARKFRDAASRNCEALHG